MTWKTVEPRPAAGDSSWFVRDRFGMFIHWGTYACPARHEWVKHRECITDADYDKYFEVFNPDLYDPGEWARAARNAGMKYFVITTKHHEGFCLWNTKQTDYNAANTPYGKDLIGPMVEAFRDEGLRVGFYYSLIDWHHPEFVVEGDPIHPMRNNAEFIEQSARRDMTKYAAYMRAQIEELLTQYGRIDYLFFDFSYPDRGGKLKGHEGWESEKLLELCRKLQPDILVNDRLDLKEQGGWDFITPEQFMSTSWPERDGQPVLWETCQTFSGSWGYHRDESTWKSVTQLLYLLIDTVSKGGNLLLNVGPTARGTFDGRAMSSLAGMGEWMKLHARSIYRCTMAPENVPTPQDCRLTFNPETCRLYVHILNWPIKQLHLPGLAGKVKYIQLLNDASELHFKEPGEGSNHEAGAGEGDIAVSVPVVKPDVAVPVLEVFLKE